MTPPLPEEIWGPSAQAGKILLLSGKAPQSWYPLYIARRVTLTIMLQSSAASTLLETQNRSKLITKRCHCRLKQPCLRKHIEFSWDGCHRVQNPVTNHEISILLRSQSSRMSTLMTPLTVQKTSNGVGSHHADPVQSCASIP